MNRERRKAWKVMRFEREGNELELIIWNGLQADEEGSTERAY